MVVQSGLSWCGGPSFIRGSLGKCALVPLPVHLLPIVCGCGPVVIPSSWMMGVSCVLIVMYHCIWDGSIEVAFVAICVVVRLGMMAVGYRSIGGCLCCFCVC